MIWNTWNNISVLFDKLDCSITIRSQDIINLGLPHQVCETSVMYIIITSPALFDRYSNDSVGIPVGIQYLLFLK